MTTGQAQKYFDSLLSIYDTISKTATSSGERGQKVAQQFAGEVTRGQREALEFSRTLATQPAEVGQHYTALFDATTRAQGRTLAFVQAAYDESLGTAADTREALEKLVDASRTATEAAMEMVREWTNTFSFAEAWQATAPKSEPVAV